MNIDTTNKRIGIDLATTPAYGLDIESNDPNTVSPRFTLYYPGNNPSFIIRNARGTKAAPAALTSIDAI